jgi:hypothetical protein
MTSMTNMISIIVLKYSVLKKTHQVNPEVWPIFPKGDSLESQYFNGDFCTLTEIILLVPECCGHDILMVT